MNKRNTEGYVLAYVLIVITVMGMIAATLMTSTLQVITAQEKSIEYMKDKYAAMGDVEKFLAEFDAKFASGPVEFSGNSYDSPSAALTAAQSRIPDIVPSGYTSASSSPDISLESDGEYTGKYTYVIYATHGQVEVKSTIITPLEIEISEDTSDEEDPDSSTYSYLITFSPFSLSTYEITPNGGDT